MSGQGGGDSMTPEEIAEMLYQALMQRATRRCCAPSPARPSSAMRAWSRAGRSAGRTTSTARCGTSTSTTCSTGSWTRPATRPPEPLTPLEERLEKDEYESRIDQLKKEIEAEIRRRLVADRGVEAMARTLRKPLPEDVDFMHASREEMAALRKAIYPLTRKLAVRLARKRRHGRKGPLDFRNTIRHSLSYGGVPAEPKFRYPRPSKPEIFVVADISGSVAAFARFTLHLVYAISHQFSKVRVVRLHRRHRRGHPALRGRRGHRRGRAPREHRGRRGLGRRPLRLRPRLRGVLGDARARSRARRRPC